MDKYIRSHPKCYEFAEILLKESDALISSNEMMEICDVD
jgi:hypothetical protein